MKIFKILPKIVFYIAAVYFLFPYFVLLPLFLLRSCNETLTIDEMSEIFIENPDVFIELKDMIWEDDQIQVKWTNDSYQKPWTPEKGFDPNFSTKEFTIGEDILFDYERIFWIFWRNYKKPGTYARRNKVLEENHLSKDQYNRYLALLKKVGFKKVQKVYGTVSIDKFGTPHLGCRASIKWNKRHIQSRTQKSEDVSEKLLKKEWYAVLDCH